MDAVTWVAVILGSVLAYGLLILAGRWVFEAGYEGE